MVDATNPDNIGNYLISASPFAEHLDMFDLHGWDFSGTVLNCPGGGSRVTAEARARGATAVAVDPVCTTDRAELGRVVVAETHRGAAHSLAGSDRCTWEYYGGPAGHTAMRRESTQVFVADLAANPARYVAAALPHLPFADRRFDLVLCSHLFFTYADRRGPDFRRAALLELARVASRELRVFPLVDQGGWALEDLTARLTTDLRARGVRVERRTVPYEFQRGGDTMMVLRQE